MEKSLPKKRVKRKTDDEYKPSLNEQLEAEEHEKEHVAKESLVSSDELYRYLRKNAGDLNSIK